MMDALDKAYMNVCLADARCDAAGYSLLITNVIVALTWKYLHDAPTWLKGFLLVQCCVTMMLFVLARIVFNLRNSLLRLLVNERIVELTSNVDDQNEVTEKKEENV